METGLTGHLPLSGSHSGKRQGGSDLPVLFHVVATLWLAGMLLFARYSPGQYVSLLQEDRPVEWGTVWLFAAAGIIHLRKAVRHRLIFDGLVALFCLFVAGEEFSWGQRLLGFGSPEYFLANNFQQEVNLHNLPGAVVKPKWVFIIALCGYGILLPVFARLVRPQNLLARIGATPPPAQLVPWYTAAVVLLLWYPVTLTGEWVEFLAGGLFIASKKMGAGTLWIVLSLALLFGVSMTKLTSAVERGRDSVRSQCARVEVQSLLNDLTRAGAATEKLKRRRAAHKRVWTAISEGYLNQEGIREFDGARCDGPATGETQSRRRYVVDPWGMSYWLYAERVDEDRQRIVVYSFGPNRRRDGTAGAPAGDDIGLVGSLNKQSE